MDEQALKTEVLSILADDRRPPDDYQRALATLRTVAGAIQDSFGSEKIRVRVEAGHQVNLGQQYSIVVHLAELGMRDVLFRAYLSMDGFPVTLALFDDARPECNSTDQLESTLLGFLRQPAVKQRLLEVKDFLS